MNKEYDIQKYSEKLIQLKNSKISINEVKDNIQTKSSVDFSEKNINTLFTPNNEMVIYFFVFLILFLNFEEKRN